MDARVFFKRQTDYELDALKIALQELVQPLGGWESILSKGDRVLLKPNLVMRAPRGNNATTNPAFVEAVICICLDFGCSIQVADAAVFGSAASVANKSGLLDVCKKYGVEVKTLGGKDSFKVNGRCWTNSSDLKWATKIINLPKLKGHCQLYYTGAIKNLFGCVVGRRKFFRHMAIGDHGNHFGQMLLDTARQVSADLHLIDGIGAMAGDGPVNGTPVELGLLGASCNPLALDWAVVDWLSGNKDKIPYFCASIEDAYWKSSFPPEISWLGERFEAQDFFFPGELMPIRFSSRHAIRSVAKSALLRLGLIKV